MDIFFLSILIFLYSDNSKGIIFIYFKKIMERTQKIGWLIRNLVSWFLSREKMEYIEEFWIITVTEVKVSKDYSYADIYVSSIKNEGTLVHELATNAHNISQLLAKSLTIRKLPKVRFRYDDSWKIADTIMQEIDKLGK